MTNTRLLVAAVALSIIAAFTAEASAYYHPATARFISRDLGPGGSAGSSKTAHFPPRDPTGTNQYADGMNLYQYAKIAPAGYVDPGGTTVIIHCKSRAKFKSFLTDLVEIAGFEPSVIQGEFDKYSGENTAFGKAELR
jgi:hypothetical protein